MSKDVNVAVIGAGKMAYWHLRAYRRISGVRIAAIANPTSERGAELARRFKIPVTARSADEILDLPGLDAVDLSVPTGLHAELALAALKRGLHVYAEKPLCRTLEEADAVVAAAAAAGKSVFVGYNLRFCPEFERAKRILNSGALGEVRFVWIQRGAWVDRDSYIFNPRWNAGIITELSSHAIDLLRWWGFRDFTSVYAAGTNVFADFPAPDTVSLNLKLRGGGLAVVSNSYGLPALCTEACLSGTNGLLRVRYGKCWVEPHPRRWSIPALLRRTLREAVVFPHRILYNPFVGSCRHFIDCVRSGRRPAVDEVEGRETMRLCRLLDQSYARQAVVSAGEP